MTGTTITEQLSIAAALGWYVCPGWQAKTELDTTWRKNLDDEPDPVRRAQFKPVWAWCYQSFNERIVVERVVGDEIPGEIPAYVTERVQRTLAAGLFCLVHK